MSSVFNNYNPELAIDGNPNTCAQTGFGTHSWWKVDLNQTRTVNSVTVYGRWKKVLDGVILLSFTYTDVIITVVGCDN